MKVQIERCWNGGDRFSFRLMPIQGGGVHIVCAGNDSGTWNRESARDAKDVIQRHYDVARENIRFVHK